MYENENLLKKYEPSEPKNKPEVLKQIKEIEEERKKMAMSPQNNSNNGGKIVINQDGKNIELNNNQIVEILQKQQEQLQIFSKLLQEKDSIINNLNIDILKYKEIINKFKNISNLINST